MNSKMAVVEPKKLVLGITGSIAAYKAAILARLLADDYSVTPILSHSACRFISPLTLSILCGQRAITDLFSAAESGEVSHVELASTAALIVIAPATAHTIARLAHGFADDPLTSTVLSSVAPVLIAPAMETQMWRNTQPLLEEWAARRERLAGPVIVVPPGAGALASGRDGEGRMAEPEHIAAAVHAAIAQYSGVGGALQHKHVVISAGPTREAFDPVRYLSNPSSGKMGYAIAQAALQQGAHVTLVSGPTALQPPPGAEIRHCTTTEEMYQAIDQAINAPHPNQDNDPAWKKGNHRTVADALIMAAAPCDYRPNISQAHKFKKTKGDLIMTLNRTPDILQSVHRPKDGKTIFIGFAAETDPAELVREAQNKLERKRLHMVVGNIVGPQLGFAHDQNQVTLVDKSHCTELPLLPKSEVALHILRWLSKAIAVQAP